MQCATVFQKRRAGVMRCSAKPRHRRGKFTRAHWRPSSKSVYEKECGTRYAFYSTQVKAIYPCEAEEQIRACGGGGGGGGGERGRHMFQVFAGPWRFSGNRPQ